MCEGLVLAAHAAPEQTQKQKRLWEPHSTRSMWMEHLGELQCDSQEGPEGRFLRKGLVPGPRGRSWWKVPGGGTQLAAGGWLPPLFASGMFPALRLPVP